ncbi:hypothetical protein L208DRAFT_1378678 [Tricholoma matsutake]|nr:hypothetical protein L208DRAFT_1378678 [Tricholoma matsutake 945]
MRMRRSKPHQGPPFTHPTLPVTAHYIGTTSPRSSPSHYLAAIPATFEADADGMYEDERIHDFIPLVINTMGWTKGLGADLNKKIEDMVQPTDVYELEGDSSTFEGQASSPPPVMTDNSYPYVGREIKSHLLTAIPPSLLSTNYTAADYRALSILSYFYAVFPSPSHFTPQFEVDTPLSLALSNPNLTALTWDTSLPLLARPPYEVDSHFFRSLVLSGAGSEDVVPTEVGTVLNAAVVGLVASQFDSELGLGSVPPGTANNEQMHTGIPYAQGRGPPSPAMSNCLGIALVRSTSASLSSAGPSSLGSRTKFQMHILTPLPTLYLAQVNVVVKGEMELPVWGWLDHRVDVADGIAGLEQGKVPYLQWGRGPEGAAGGVRKRVRRNLMRRGQM